MVEFKQHDLGVVKTIEGCLLHQQDDANSSFVTFIIPSKGRDSIDRTVHSLFNQTRNLWKAYDMIVSCFQIIDKRFHPPSIDVSSPAHNHRITLFP